jgi:hypothetical protein
VSSPPCAGLLHTATIHGEPFHDLLAEAAPGVEQVHVTDPRLLAAAVHTGVTPEVQAEVTRHIDHLVASGATAVLVTCSSIGEAVEAAAEQASVPVLRLDEPMAREAIATAQADVVVLAQATMASAATDTGVRVLTSPRSGVAALVEAIREPHPDGGVDR